MALDPQKLRALVPLLSDDEYQRRRRKLLMMTAGALVLAIGLVATIGSSAFTAHARMLVVFAILCSAAAAGVSGFGLFVLWFGQRVARRAHAYANELDRRAS